MARYRSRPVPQAPVRPVVQVAPATLPGGRYQAPRLPSVASPWAVPATDSWMTGVPLPIEVPETPGTVRAPGLRRRPGLGQWEALIPVATGLVRGFMSSNGGGGSGVGGGVTQVATQSTVLTPVQTTAVTVQTGSGQITQPVPAVGSPIPTVQGPGGIAVRPGMPAAGAAVIEEPAPGFAGLPWWVPLAGAGVLAWLLWRD